VENHFVAVYLKFKVKGPDIFMLLLTGLQGNQKSSSLRFEVCIYQHSQ